MSVPTHRAPNASSKVLQLNRVGKQFGTDPPVHALVDVELSVYHGEWLSITGPSGAGKSTLLNILGCLDRLTSGSYSIDGIDTAQLTDAQRTGLRSRRVGFVFQSFHLLPYRTVLENVMLADVYRQAPQAGRRDRALAALERFMLSHRVDFLPGKLSAGEQQRVAIARALVGSPSVLLCDEPTGNLDSKSTGSILDFFEKLNQEGLTLVVVTHDENVAKRGSRRVLIVDGTLAELTNAETQKEPTKSERPTPIGNVPRSGITVRDLLGEAFAGMFARPVRSMLTVVGVVIGLTALVATIGLTRTAQNRIISQFDQLAATEVFVSAKVGIIDPNTIPWDAPSRLRRLNGVVAVGMMGEVDVGDALISASAVNDPQNQTAFKMSVYAATPGLFSAVRGDLRTGRFPDLGHSDGAYRVAVLGPDAASRLGIVSLKQLPAISIGDYLYLVVGILRDVARRPELLGSVMIPEGTARRDFRLTVPGVVVVETKIGAANLIFQQAPVAVRPDVDHNDTAQQILKVDSPQEPVRLKDDVQTELNVMFVLLVGLTLIVGAIGIANITLVSVMERTGEIGLRRAIGATRVHIAAQFLLESATMGVIGGILGASLGILIVIAVSAYHVWTPVLDPPVPLLTPFVGAVIGLLSGTYPALRAANLEPVDAIRT